VGQPKRERAAVVVDVGGADLTAQNLGLRGLVELLDLAVALRIPGCYVVLNPERAPQQATA
jgi:hypothetical protein